MKRRFIHKDIAKKLTGNYRINGGSLGHLIAESACSLKNDKRTLTLAELPIYAPCITTHEGNTLEVKDGQIFITGEATADYTFKQDYYWMMGDNRDCSADSRFWGFVPEDHIVGKPLFIWLSLDPDRGIFNGGLRWKRLFKSEF